jgi:hypothetical protein
LEHRGRGPENKIRGPFDITILEILTAPVGINSVLPAQETAIVEYRLVPRDIDGQCLAHRPCAVLESDIGRVKPGRIHEKTG